MSRRNLTVLSLGKNILYNIPKSITIQVNNKLKIRLIKNNNKVLLSPKSVDYVNYVNKRNYSPCKNSGDKKNYNRHIYDEKLEKLVNDQINVEFGAGYAYLCFAVYFGRSNVALPGCYGYFMKMYYEELQHGLDFINYQTLRGGVVKLQPIIPLKEIEYSNISETIALALTLEKTVKEKLRYLYRIASECHDTHLQDKLDPFIDQQEKSIYEMARLLTRATELSSSEVGRYLFDRELHETHVKKDPGSCTAEVGSKLYT